MDKKFIAQIFQRALGDLGHRAVLDEYRQDAHTVEACHAQNGVRKAGEIIALFGQQGQDVAVDQGLHKQGALHLGKDGQQNAAKHQNDLHLILLHHIGEDALKHLAGVFYLGAGAMAAAAGAHFDYFRLLCHYASPPFSSKSPEPLV